jgi:lysine 6-dehydrogenase
VDRYDPVTGFSAMERLTGWHAAIMAGFVADATVAPGVHPVERAMSAGSFLEAFRGRGFEIVDVEVVPILASLSWDVTFGSGRRGRPAVGLSRLSR